MGLLVVVGALVGAPLRVWVTRLAVRLGQDPAMGTLAVNVAGCAVLGALTGVAGADAVGTALVGTGFCGTLTTFSTFGADVLRLLDLRRLLGSLAYVAASLVLGVGAAVVAWVMTAGSG
jgi:CrcB protein